MPLKKKEAKMAENLVFFAYEISLLFVNFQSTKSLEKKSYFQTFDN